MVTSNLLSTGDSIGEVFTPVHWARWALEKRGIFERWRDGAVICDPTAGQGAFVLALFQIAQDRGVPVTDEMLSRLYLIEIKRNNLDNFLTVAKNTFGISFPVENTFCTDVIVNTPNINCDILVGNPPWANFSDLPLDYKETLKPFFQSSGLIKDKGAMLLGASRIDIAALVLETVIGKILNDNGEACFFIPRSLFSGDDAHAGFRDYEAFGTPFAISEVFEFTRTKVFEKIGASYCCAYIKKGTPLTFPVAYSRETSNSSWEKLQAFPLSAKTDAWRLVPEGASLSHPEISISQNQKPRQGVNTCGANSVFFFDEYPDFIEAKFLFPLATKDIWGSNGTAPAPKKWVFLPYDRLTGKPLSEGQLSGTKAYSYLLTKQKELSERKGLLVNNAINKGCWWFMLGVGSYSFAPHKVIWEAYGKRSFNPMILSSVESQPWQANQSLHAFIPAWSRADAERVLSELSAPSISSLLEQLNGAGQCNWAQPGKMKKIFSLSFACEEQMVLL